MPFSHSVEDFASRIDAAGGDVFVGLESAFALVGERGFVEEELVGLGGEDVLRGDGGIEPCVAEPGGERVRDVDRHLHGVSVAPVAVGKKAILVVPLRFTPALRLRSGQSGSACGALVFWHG
jgi:hypothetical protein